jgi:NADH-quinone oxidoreductase subunit H
VTFLDFVLMVVRVIAIFALVMTLVPALIYLERKVVAQFQLRVGPNRVGPLGMMQPLADALKLMMKEDITPSGADRAIYFMAPMMAMIPALLAAAVIPFGPAVWTRITDLNHSVLYSFALSSLAVYAVALGGWASNNKYSLIGAIRSASQMISYELPMGLSIIALIMLTQTTSLAQMVEQQHLLGWNIFRAPTMFIAFIIYFICGIAETNRAPFDLAEAETELVGGFHTEYSSFKFAMFFMAEYVHMVIMAALATTMFLGGWSGPGVSYYADAAGNLAINNLNIPMALLGVFYFVLKMATFLYIYFWLRASMPRFRYDQLMNFGWKRLLPYQPRQHLCDGHLARGLEPFHRQRRLVSYRIEYSIEKTL